MSRKPTDTKQRILDTAANLFSSYGFGCTSIDDILTAVGITKGAFYHYFKSKDALCEAVLDHAIEEFNQLALKFQGDEDTPDLLKRWLQLLIEKQDSGQWLHLRLLSRLSVDAGQFGSSIRNKLQTFWRWYQSFYETLIRKTARQKDIDLRIQPAEAAKLFTTTHFGALWLNRGASSATDLTAVSEALLKTLLK
ncbi:MAG: TetR/AcrR family transcriptional regulator [Planctomycetota bacterium]|jgi:AcrR family transcriptional regulator